MTDVNGQVLDSSRSLGMTGGMGRGGPRESRLRGRALAKADVNGQVLDSSRSLGMTGGMGCGGTMRVARTGEGSGHDGCEWASPRFLAEPRNDRGYGAWGDHESRAYGGGLWP